MIQTTYKCKVDGVLGRSNKHFAICPFIKFGNQSLCGAKESTQCVHKEIESPIAGGLDMPATNKLNTIKEGKK